jgi:hypothetical protein
MGILPSHSIQFKNKIIEKYAGQGVLGISLPQGRQVDAIL